MCATGGQDAYLTAQSRARPGIDAQQEPAGWVGRDYRAVDTAEAVRGSNVDGIAIGEVPRRTAHGVAGCLIVGGGHDAVVGGENEAAEPAVVVGDISVETNAVVRRCAGFGDCGIDLVDVAEDHVA